MTKDDIAKMTTAWAAATSYRVTFTGVEEGKPVSFLMEVVKPDKQHFKVSAGGQGDIEIIQIGTDSYVNFGGTWTKSTGASPVSVDMFNPDEIREAFDTDAASGVTITKGATRTVGGAQCQDWTKAGGSEDDAGTMCVGVSDNLPREFTSPDGSSKLTFSDWNSPIVIAAPI